MNRPLGRSLRFHIRHAEDVDALEQIEEGERPASIPAEDWEKFNAVLSLASDQAGAVLVEIRDALLDVARPSLSIGAKSTDKSTREYWSGWFDVEVRHAGKVGLTADVIVCITSSPPPDRLFLAVRSKGGAARKREVFKALRDRGVADMRDFAAELGSSDTAVLHEHELKEDDDVDALRDLIVASFERALPHLLEL